MIRTETLVNTRQIDLLDSFIEAFPTLAKESVETRLRRNVYSPFLSELRYYPREAQNGLNSANVFVWSVRKAANDRARRWFFANYPNGYKRTGAFGRAWELSINEGLNNISLSVKNPTRATKLIVGDARTGEGQIPGHINTGWPQVSKTIDFWQQEAGKEAVEAVDELVRGRA